MSCDIGIVGYDCFDVLERCLLSVHMLERPLPGKVFVVENGPAPVPEALKSSFPHTFFHENPCNRGFAAACNQILAYSDAKYVCFLNPDTVLKHAFVNEAVSWLDEHLNVAVLGPKIVEPDGSVQGSARAFPSLATAFFGRSSLLTRFLPANPLSRRNILTSASVDGAPMEVDWVSGACMVVRKKAVQEVGMMDEGFFMYWEDCDWCRRFWQNGWKVVYHPGMGPVEHAAGSASRKARLKTLYWFHKSAVRLYAKYDCTPMRVGSAAALAGAVARFLLLFPFALRPGR